MRGIANITPLPRSFSCAKQAYPRGTRQDTQCRSSAKANHYTSLANSMPMHGLWPGQAAHGEMWTPPLRYGALWTPGIKRCGAGLGDFRQRLAFAFARWRWLGQDAQTRRIMLWTVGPLLAFLLYRLCASSAFAPLTSFPGKCGGRLRSRRAPADPPRIREAAIRAPVPVS